MIVSNYSDLTPAMRSGLDRWNTAKAATRKALIARGLVKDHGGELTDAGRRAQAHILADVPAKIAPYLDRARQLGLEVHRSEDAGTLKSWTIGTPNPIDRTQLWLYWSPGARGGRLGVTIHYGPMTKTKRPPLRHIWYTIQSMAESLERHNQREAEAQKRPAGQPANNLLHEELNLSTVHGNNGQGAALCGSPILPGDMTTVAYPIDCAACLKIWPTFVAAPAGGVPWDQPGANPVADLARFKSAAENQAGQGEIDDETRIAEELGLTVTQLRERTDPARPGWFLVGQVIRDADTGVWYQIVDAAPVQGRVPNVAVSLNGGYGKTWQVYGDRPDAVGPLSELERNPGYRDADRRPWPSLRAAQEAVTNLLKDQCLTGWASGQFDNDDKPFVSINLPAGADPTRHLVLVRRYCPYLAEVTLVNVNVPYAMIHIKARKD